MTMTMPGLYQYLVNFPKNSHAMRKSVKKKRIIYQNELYMIERRKKFYLHNVQKREMRGFELWINDKKT